MASRASASPEPVLIEHGLRQGHPAGRHQRAVFRDPRGLRGARRADRDRRGHGWSPTPSAASSPPSTASRPAPRWRRCSPTCRKRSRRRSRSRSAAPTGRATLAPILPRFSVGEDHASVDEGAELRRQAVEGLERRHRRAWAGARPHRRGLPRAARFRARRHRGDEISRLLPDRRRLHPVGEGAGHPGRAGPRLRRRLAGRLCADHHRSRSDPLRAAVRALPQSRARVDAGLRYRLLPGPARRGDPLRPGQVRPRPGRADHHLRHAAGARRAARRRPRAADAVRAGRQALQAGAAEPGQSGHAQARHRRRAAAAGRARPRSGGAARLRHRAEARRACTATPRPTPPAS